MRRLLDAGVEVFAKRGFHSARVDDIVKAAKTSHGTFYLYFSNKEDLFRALTEEVADEMTGLAEGLGDLTPDAAGYGTLRSWLEDFSGLYERFAPIISAWTEAETGRSEVGQLGTELLARFSEVLAERVKASGVDDVHPQVAALAVVAMVERYHYYAHSGLLRGDRSQVLDTLASATHAGLFGAKAVP